MKIAFRGGHNFKAIGARALIDEVTENRLVLAECIELAKQQGHEVLDCTPGDCDSNTDLYTGVTKANNWGADIYVPIHFNKCYAHYEGKIGTEVIVWSQNNQAAGIVKNLSDLGFRNRGQKINQGLYDLRMSDMTACIVEVCFVEATEDVDLYKSLGPKKIAKAIVEGIIGSQIIDKPKPEIPKPKPNTSQPPVFWDYMYDPWVKKLQSYLNDRGHRLSLDGKAGENTYNAIKGYTLSLNERATLARLVQERLNNMGYDAGVVDGIVGAKTYKAINKFQADNGLGQGFLGGTDWKYLIR